MRIIIANVICIFSYLVLFFCTFLNTNRKTIVVCFFSSCALYGIQSLILGGYSGAFAQFFSCLMYVVYFFKEKNKFLSSIIIPILFSFGYIAIGIITYNNAFDLLPLFASLLACITMWSNKEFIMKVFNIPISFMWITYSFIYMSYTGAIGQTVVLISDIAYIILYFKKYRH